MTQDAPGDFWAAGLEVGGDVGSGLGLQFAKTNLRSPSTSRHRSTSSARTQGAGITLALALSTSWRPWRAFASAWRAVHADALWPTTSCSPATPRRGGVK